MKFMCCFCGKQIKQTEVDPLVIAINSDGTDEETNADTQSFYSHATCFESKLFNNTIPFRWFSTHTSGSSNN